jgi:D-serine deaminase-like pyridoxal phosphate-dependent protein
MASSSFDSSLSAVRAAPAVVGGGLSTIQTPALVVDKDALLSNLRRLPSLLQERNLAHVRIRAHFKAHKCGAIAKLQVEEGRADGFCFQKVSEMEGLIRFFEEDVAHSSTPKLDLLITNEVVERSKLRRISELSHHPRVKRVGVAVDDEGVLEVLIEEARQAGAAGVGVVIEVDVGQQRCGIDIESVEGRKTFLSLAKRLITAHRDPSGHVSFIGLQAYHGCKSHAHAQFTAFANPLTSEPARAGGC